MIAYIVTMWSGHRTTVRAEAVRPTDDGYYEFFAAPAPSMTDPNPVRQLVALFASRDVMSVVAKEFLVSEEHGTVPPHVVSGNDQIPF